MKNLTSLRTQMKERGLDAYLIVSGDPHSSEIVANHWRVREWFSGFTGSAGLVVVTQKEAGLWTDGRYFIQAEKELEGTGISLFKDGEPGVPKYTEFLADKLPKNGRLGFDGRTIDYTEFEIIKKALSHKNISYAYLEDVAGNLWADRPQMPTGKAFYHEAKFSGPENKLEIVRNKMKEKGYSFYLVSGLDDICWLANIRGSDVLHSPLVYSYVLITEKEACLFVDTKKVLDITAKLNTAGFTISEYDSLPEKLKNLSKSGSILLNGKKTNIMLTEALPGSLTIVQKPSLDIIPLLKAVKSETEIANMRNAYVRDSKVIVKTLIHIEEILDHGNEITECDVVEFLAESRKKEEYSLGDSFSTIVGYGANAAMMHYRPVNGGATIKPEGLLLIDTGGQYLDGTTDTTRTFPVGPITDEMKKDFTLVLKGHINLANAIFLKGTTGYALDVLARQPLWQNCQNYRSGTGHGIGFCLGVHEGPQNIAPKPNTTELLPGMVVSNEPGVYKEGRYGIRTENIILIEEYKQTEDGTFLNFTPLTYVPISIDALDISLLTIEETKYLNDYHKAVFDMLSPLLNEKENAWLKNATRPV